MKKFGKKYLFTFGLIIILIIISIFIFQSWQDNTKIINQATINETIFPNNTNTEIARETKEKGEPDHISIPDVDIEIPIIYITQEENNEEGYQAALANGVVQYPGTAIPGEYGNPYIFGHSSDFFWKDGDYKEIFKSIIDLPLDTIIRITNHEGDLFVYKVIETKIVGPDEVSVLDQQNYERQILTLQTSWPLGTALKRYLVIAELDPEATYKSKE